MVEHNTHASNENSQRNHNPRRIQPLGNLLLSDDSQAGFYRQWSLGNLARLSDELLLKVFSEMEAEDLYRAQGISRYFFSWCAALDGLWKAALLTRQKRLTGWTGTWRSTYLGRLRLETDVIKLPTVYSDVLFQPILAAGYTVSSTVAVNRSSFLDTIERVRGDETMWLDRDRPVILTGMTEAWGALEWTLESLSERFRDIEFRAESTLVTLQEYKAYHDRCQTEESPLYLFDADFVEKTAIVEEGKGLGADYTAPAIFGTDLFACLGIKRPDFRWLIIGPSRSGSTWHKDPNGTSAWNAVIKGRKLWICFPPDVTPPGVWATEDESEVESPLSIAEWFINYYRHAKEEYGSKAKDLQKRGKMIEGICQAGEIFYVPSGWWHLVVNLEASIAITQNFVSEIELAGVLRFMKYRPEQLSGFRLVEKEKVLPDFIEALRTTGCISLRQLEANLELMNQTDERASEPVRTVIKRKKPPGKSETLWETLKKQKVEDNGQVYQSDDQGGFVFGFELEDVGDS